MTEVTARRNELEVDVAEVSVVEIDMSAAPLAIELSRDAGDSHRLTVRGELDISSAPHLQGKLAEAMRANAAQIVVDLRDISFIDSTGLGVLVSARQRAKTSGVPLKLRLPEGSARFPFQVTGLINSFDD